MFQHLDEEDNSFLENEDFLFLYEQIFNSSIQKCNFKLWFDVIKAVTKNTQTDLSAKSLQTRTYNLLKKCLNSMIENQSENCSVLDNYIYIEVFGLNYPDPEKQASVNISFRLENIISKISDIFVFDEVVDEQHLSHDERITSLENRVKALEKKIGI